MTPLQSVAQLGCPDGWSVDLQGWHSTHPFFEKMIGEVNPSVIVEVGSWKGASAIHMAECAKRLHPIRPTSYLAAIFCCDTWQGGIDHYVHEDTPPNSLLRKHGYPQLYFQFLKNVTDSGYADRIFPVVQTSVNCAKVLALHGVVSDLTYIDAGHDLKSVYDDLEAFWPITRKGGVMFGDDANFGSVLCSVTRFALERDLRMDVYDGIFWTLREK